MQIKHDETIKTPFYSLNEIISGGFRLGTLSIIGGLTCMGKTAFLICLIKTWFKQKICFFSFDEKAGNIFNRIISTDAEVEYNKIISNNLNAEEFQSVEECINRFKENDFLTISDWRETFWEDIEQAIKNGNKIIMIDTLQLLVCKIDIYQEMSIIVNRLKEIAIQNNVCVIVTSQLSRKVLERAGNRPRLNDLRDSGYIEECADQVFLIHRREFFDPHDKPGQAEIIVAKNRFGKTGVVNLAFRKEIQEFVNSTM